MPEPCMGGILRDPAPSLHTNCTDWYLASLVLKSFAPLPKIEDLWCYLYRNSDPRWFPALPQGLKVFSFFTFFLRCSGLSPVPSKWQSLHVSCNISRLAFCGIQIGPFSSAATASLLQTFTWTRGRAVIEKLFEWGEILRCLRILHGCSCCCCCCC